MPLAKNKVSCIIPAYNESKSITSVVKVCLATSSIGEVIVVNDGSTDATLKKLSPFKRKIKLINLGKNQGKGFAVSQGIKKARYDYLLFLDADMYNVKPHHLSSLTKPVLNKEVDMTIGILCHPEEFRYWRYWQSSGQRCLRKKLVTPFLERIEKTRYGLEFLLNFKLKKRKIAAVPLISYQPLHLPKEKKQKDWLAAYVKEIGDLFKEVVKNKSATYKKRAQKELVQTLSTYSKLSAQKIKQYLEIA